MNTYRHQNRADRRAIRRVARLVAGESPSQRRRREAREKWMYGSRPEERAAYVRRRVLGWAVITFLLLGIPVACAWAYLAGLRAGLDSAPVPVIMLHAPDEYARPALFTVDAL